MIETLVLAALSGLAIAGLGAFKDTREYDGVRYEDFSYRVFGRSVALACLVACAVWWLNWLNLRTAAPPTIVLVIVASERLITGGLQAVCAARSGGTQGAQPRGNTGSPG